MAESEKSTVVAGILYWEFHWTGKLEPESAGAEKSLAGATVTQ